MDKKRQFEVFAEEVKFDINNELDSLKDTKDTKLYLDDFDHLMANLILAHYRYGEKESIENCGNFIFVMEAFLDWYNDPEHGYYYDIDGGLGQLFKDAINYAARNVSRKIVEQLIESGAPYDRNKLYTIDNKFIDDFKKKLDNKFILENMF